MDLGASVNVPLADGFLFESGERWSKLNVGEAVPIDMPSESIR